MMHNAEWYGTLAREQYGSRKKHRLNIAALNKQLTMDLLRLRRLAGAFCSNDASSQKQGAQKRSTKRNKALLKASLQSVASKRRSKDCVKGLRQRIASKDCVKALRQSIASKCSVKV
jgi:hypothetical protein